MNGNIHHRNVKMNLVFASVIAQKLYQLDDILGVTSASVTLERDDGSPPTLRILVELDSRGTRLVAEGCDPEPGTALLKLLRLLQAKARLNSHPMRLPGGNARSRARFIPVPSPGVFLGRPVKRASTHKLT